MCVYVWCMCGVCMRACVCVCYLYVCCALCVLCMCVHTHAHTCACYGGGMWYVCSVCGPCVCGCGCTFSQLLLWRLENNFGESTVSFQYVDSWHVAQVIILTFEFFYLLTRLTGLALCLLKHNLPLTLNFTDWKVAPERNLSLPCFPRKGNLSVHSQAFTLKI